MVISIDSEKTFDKFQIYDKKVLIKVVIERIYLNTIKAIDSKPTVLTLVIRQEKLIKKHPNWKRRNKTVAICWWHDTTYRKP